MAWKLNYGCAKTLINKLTPTALISYHPIAMKKVYLSTAVLIGFVAASLQAGTETYKQVAAPPPPPMIWTRLLRCDRHGCKCLSRPRWRPNVYGDDRFLDPTDRDFDATLRVSPKNDVGFFGGVKLGYVFGSGVVRPTVEGDFFYNGFRGGANFTLNDRFDDIIGQRNVTTWVNTGAFMANFILRFAPGNQRFQPYAGAGVGVYYAESAGVEVVDPVTGRVPVNTGGGASHADLAWQIIAGSDYYFNPEISAFIEYNTSNTRAPKSKPAKLVFWDNSSRRGCSIHFSRIRAILR